MRRDEMPRYWLRIELAADQDAPLTVMFEPTGMSYEVAAGDRMYADVEQPVDAKMRVINWKGGLTIWAPGPVVTRDAQGIELHRLN